MTDKYPDGLGKPGKEGQSKMFYTPSEFYGTGGPASSSTDPVSSSTDPVSSSTDPVSSSGVPVSSSTVPKESNFPGRSPFARTARGNTPRPFPNPNTEARFRLNLRSANRVAPHTDPLHRRSPSIGSQSPTEEGYARTLTPSELTQTLVRNQNQCPLAGMRRSMVSIVPVLPYSPPPISPSSSEETPPTVRRNDAVAGPSNHSSGPSTPPTVREQPLQDPLGAMNPQIDPPAPVINQQPVPVAPPVDPQPAQPRPILEPEDRFPNGVARHPSRRASSVEPIPPDNCCERKCAIM